MVRSALRYACLPLTFHPLFLFCLVCGGQFRLGSSGTLLLSPFSLLEHSSGSYCGLRLYTSRPFLYCIHRPVFIRTAHDTPTSFDPVDICHPTIEYRRLTFHLLRRFVHPA